MKAKTVFVPALFLFMLSCQNANKESSAEMVMIDPMSADTIGISSSAAVEKQEESTRRFIRTADIKFKVKNVIQSTADVEEIATRQGGFVTFTNLTSNVENVTTIPVSEDSSLETTTFKVVNSMILRVPDTKLDTTLREIAKNVDYMDYRIIKADDVALQLLSNEMTAKRAVQHQNRLKQSIGSRVSKLGETVTAEESVSEKQEQGDNAKIALMKLTDEISFSTVSLNIYQRQAIKKELIAINRNIKAYEPGFGSRLLESVLVGWQVLETLVLFIAKMWAVLLAGLVVYVGYRSYKRVVFK